MSKKNVISDFSSLKGTVTFSEKASVVENPERKETKSVLKVGQKVVLMDSDLRGKIISLGRTVEIELEDGLTIQATYGEFAVTEDHEIHALKHSKVKTKKTSSHSRPPTAGTSAGTLTVDRKSVV